MGCSFFPDWSLDDYCRERCAEHDAVYRNLDSKVWDKIKADCSLGWRIFQHGYRIYGRGTWYIFVGIVMGLGSLVFGWWAWRYRQHKSE